ncbi:hypothetical protein ACG04Q_02535 [Roseateles sp. DXS20W]|uniref:SCP domain-containing protein n=2 Tax=Pelomonas lactea TaxID=3299030 RepID=A0ABW7GEQ1_9BURK
MEADTCAMPCFARITRLARLAPLACLALLAPSFAAPAECGQVTNRHIPAPTQRPASCIAVQLQHATVLLDKALAEAHARGLIASHPGDDHNSMWTTRRARSLLESVTPRAALDSCASVDGRGRADDWLFYIAFQLDRGHAAVQASDADAPTDVIVVRERSMGCSPSLGDTSTRAYGIPGGRWFLPLLTGIS